MAIDVLSDPGSAPIIVGDESDMLDLQGVSSDPEGQYHLLMNGQIVALSSPASENFRTAKHLLLVNVTGEKVVSARKVRIDNLDDGRNLSDDQCRALAKALTLSAGAASREFFTEALAEFRRTYPELAAA